MWLSDSSGEKTESGLIYSGRCWLSGVQIATDGSNAVTVIIYDNTAGSGKKLAKIKVIAQDLYGGRNWVFPVKADKGLYLSLTGTGGSAIVEYIMR